MKLGIVGLPNVGKSTLFNAITNAGAESANYPFCTIEPNVGMVAVPDERLDKLAEMYHPKKKTPAVIEFVDIAGLVKGASQGAGLGNKFLENIRRTDAIVHVVRCFDDENIMHVVADASTNVPVDPLGDIETIDLELIMADLEMVNRRVEKATKMAKGDKKFLHEVELFSALAKHLDAGKSARTFEVSSDDAELIATADLLSLKPIIYAANMDEDGFANQDGNQYLQQVKELADREGAQVLPICAKLEQDIAELDGEDRAMFLEELGIEDGDTVSSIHSWKCLHLLQFLLQSVAEYATSLEQVGARGRNDVQEGNCVVDLLFWLDAHSLLPASPTLLDLASEDNTLFPTMKGVCTTKPSGDRGLWNALSSLFGGEADTLSEELKTAIQEVIQEANIEDFFLKSNRMKVNAWIVLFKARLSNDHVHPFASIASLSSLFMLKLHWMVLLLSKNTDRIGMVWGLVISFLERVRTMAMEKVAAKGGSE